MKTRGSINTLLTLCLCGASLHSRAAAAEAPASGLATAPEEARAKEAAVRGAFEKFHAAIKAGQGKLALEMRSKESLGRMTEEQKASWRRRPPIRNYAPNASSVSLRMKTAGVYYTLKDSRGKLACSFDLFLLEDGQWKLHLTRVQNHALDDLARSFWLPPDTAPFIEDGEDWSKIETVPTGDPDWTLQAISDSVFLHIRFTHATDLPLPGSLLKNDPPPSEMVYTPGVSIGASDLREGIRLSVGEVIGTRMIQKKSQSFVSYSLTFRRRGDKSYSAHVDTAGGVLKILGRCIDVRVPRETLTDIPLNPLRIWVTPKAPATMRELTVKDWVPATPPPPKPAPVATSSPLTPDPVIEAAKQAMRDLATRVISGDSKAFDELRAAAKRLYENADPMNDRKRFMTDLLVMQAAYGLFGEQAAKGNTNAFEAIKLSLGRKPLNNLAAHALGIAAAHGHAEATQILLHYDQYGILRSSAIYELRAAAEQKNAQVIEFFLAILDNPSDRNYWHEASQALVASRDNPKVKAALEKYEVANRKPAGPPSATVPAALASRTALDTAKQAMRTLATRIADGDEKAFDELLDTVKKLYRDIDYNQENDRLVTNAALMHAAFDILGEQAGKGNTRAFDALKRSLRVRHLSSFAPDALGIAAAQGHAEALDILLHHEQYQILKSTVVYSLHEPAAKNNEKAIAFLLAVLEDPTHRALWYGAAQGLAAAKETPKIKAALEKYEAANRKHAEPAR